MTETLDLSTYSAALDVPDSRDYTHDEVYGEIASSATLPSRVMYDNAPNLNQGSIGACTVFWSTNAYNETYAQACVKAEALYGQPYDPWLAWDECKRRGASDIGGWIFQSALQVLKDLKYIGAYVNINTSGFGNADRMKAVIAGGKAIATGIKYANWWQIKATWEFYSDGKTLWGHIFDFSGYDDNYRFANGEKWGFYSENSWGGVGRFWYPYSLVKNLYAQYEFVLSGQDEAFIEAKKKRRTVNLQKAYDAKIWNESEPARLATASEIRIMVNRALWLGDNYEWLRKMAFHLVNDKIVRDKVLMIYNERDPYKIASDEEFAVMFTRGVMRNPGINELVLSREQVAEIVARDFL